MKPELLRVRPDRSHLDPPALQLLLQAGQRKDHAVDLLRAAAFCIWLCSLRDMLVPRIADDHDFFYGLLLFHNPSENRLRLRKYITQGFESTAFL